MMFGSLSALAFGAAATKKKKPKKKIQAAARSGVGHFKTAAPSSGDATRLQTALVVLGKTVGNGTLSAITVDGALGPKSASAVNLALKSYTTTAPANLRTGALTLAYIKANASVIAGVIESEIKARGGSVVAPNAVIKAQVSPALVAVSKTIIKRLQTALITLGKITKDSTLRAIKADGAAGAKTVAAVNRAFMNYIGQARIAAYATGRATFNLDDVRRRATQIASDLETEITRRGTESTQRGVALKAKAKAAKDAAALKRQMAATLRLAAKSNPAQAAQYEAQAVAAETAAKQDDIFATQADTQAADASEAANTAADIPSTPIPVEAQAALTTAAAAAAASAPPSAEENVFTPGDTASKAPPSAEAPDAPEAPEPKSAGGEGFFAAHKWPIIGGAGALMLAIVAALALKKKK